MGFVKPYLKQADYICFIVSVAILPLSIKLSSKLLFIAILLGLIRSIYTKDFRWFSNQKPIIIFSVVFVLYIIVQGLVLDGTEVLLKTFDRAYAPYLIFIFVPLFYNNDRIVKQIPIVLIAGICTLFFLIIVNSLIELQWYNREKVLEVFDMHHLYISLYILFVINFLFSEVSKFNIKSTAVLLSIMVLFLFFFKSKAAIIAALFLSLYHTILRLKLTWLKIIIIGLIFGGLIFIFNTFLLELYLRALDFRTRIWEVALDYILQNPLLGYGGNHEHDLLNKGHFLNGNYDFLDSNLNAHNQFLTFLLKFGIIGFLLILFSFISPLFKMNFNLKKEYFGFLILFFCMGFIESLYNRHHGIVFCTIALYYYNSIKDFKSIK